MCWPSFFSAAFPGFLFGEAATSEGEWAEIAEWKAVMEKIIGELKKEPQLIEKLKSLLRSTLHDDQFALISCLLTHSTVKKMIGEYATKCKQQIKMGTAGQKNTATATSIRLQGNQLFVKKEYRVAFKIYTRALMFAKDEDEETPLLFANRSAVYFYLKQYENTLEDIERAFKFGYGQLKPIGKLLIRKGFSLLALGRDDEVKELLDANLPENENEPDFAQWQQLKKQSENVNRKITKHDITMSKFQDVTTVSAALSIEGIFRSHERYPWLNAKIDLLFDAEKRFHLVSKEEMKYGEIVALSKPFVSLDPKRDSYERCHYCMVPCFEVPKYFSDESKLAHEPKLSPDCFRMVTPLACTECSNVLYCSEACRTAAWTAYHRFECSQMAILAKMGSESHLALRMLYMMGSLEKNIPNNLLIYGFEPFPDYGALMVDQQAYTFVYSNQLPMLVTLDKNIERTLTVCFLLKLVQMSDLLVEPKNIDDKLYVSKAIIACLRLVRLIYQGDVNETMPFTDPTTNLAVTPSPVLHVHGMKSMLKPSCEATVDSSSRLSESFESNVKLHYATGDIQAGTVLTLAYDIEDRHTVERFNNRKYQLDQRYRLECNCTRCVREERDCLDSSSGIYYPIACSLCGSLMVRDEENDDSYRCSSTDRCNFKYSAQQMKSVYERVEKMMEAKRSAPLCMQQTYRIFQPKVKQLKIAIKSTAQLLYGRSILLAHLYRHLASCYFLITMAPISNSYSGLIGEEISSATHTLNRGHLTTALLYTNKALDILERIKQGPGTKTQFIGDCAFLFEFLDMLEPIILELYLVEMLLPIEQVRRRYEALLKMTAFDTMVASSLAAKE